MPLVRLRQPRALPRRCSRRSLNRFGRAVTGTKSAIVTRSSGDRWPFPPYATPTSCLGAATIARVRYVASAFAAVLTSGLLSRCWSSVETGAGRTLGSSPIRSVTVLSVPARSQSQADEAGDGLGVEQHDGGQPVGDRLVVGSQEPSPQRQALVLAEHRGVVSGPVCAVGAGQAGGVLGRPRPRRSGRRRGCSDRRRARRPGRPAETARRRSRGSRGKRGAATVICRRAVSAVPGLRRPCSDSSRIRRGWCQRANDPSSRAVAGE